MPPQLPLAMSTRNIPIDKQEMSVVGGPEGHGEDFIATKCVTGEVGGSYCELPAGHRGPDDQLAENAVTSVRLLTNYTKVTGHPFWLGVGFHKPVSATGRT